MTSTGSYSDPSFLIRQNLFLGRTVAGAAGTSIILTNNENWRIRYLSAGVITSGTTVGTGVGAAGVAVNVFVGSAIVSGTVATLSTNAKGVFGTSGDMNYAVPAGGTIAIVNGTDATFVATVQLEYHIDPAPTTTWVGP